MVRPPWICSWRVASDRAIGASDFLTIDVREAAEPRDPAWFRSTGTVAAVAFGVVWIVVLGMILRHRIFVSSDTVSNYAHVWFVSRVMVRTHGIPYHMAIIGHGHGLAFPYTFVPWVTAALLRPWLGDWVVTLWLVIGSIGLVATTVWAFPELRRGWWLALVLANPFLIVAPVLGQLPFVWAMSLLLAGIACWRRGRIGWAIVLAGIGQATHAAVVLPIAAIVVVFWLRWEPERRKLLRSYALSLVIAAPAAVLVFLTPAYTDSSTGVKLVNFVETVAPRLLVVLVPMGLVWLRRRDAKPWIAPAFLAAMIVTSLVLAGQHDTNAAWRDLRKQPERSLVPFIDSAAYRPGLEYRVLAHHRPPHGHVPAAPARRAPRLGVLPREHRAAHLAEPGRILRVPARPRRRSRDRVPPLRLGPARERAEAARRARARITSVGRLAVPRAVRLDRISRDG